MMPNAERIKRTVTPLWLVNGIMLQPPLQSAPEREQVVYQAVPGLDGGMEPIRPRAWDAKDRWLKTCLENRLLHDAEVEAIKHRNAMMAFWPHPSGKRFITANSIKIPAPLVLAPARGEIFNLANGIDTDVPLMWGENP